MLITSSRRLAGRGGRSDPAARPFERWTLLVLRHRYAVLAAWLAIVVSGGVLVTALPRLLASSYAVPGTESARAATALARGFHERTDGTFTVVFPVRDAPDRQLVTTLRHRLERAAQTLPGGHVASFRVAGGVVYGDLETTAGLQDAKQLTGGLRRLLRREGPALVTGEPALQHDLEPRLAADLRLGEGVALPLVFVVLALVLGWSLGLVIPFVFAASTIAGTVVLVWVCARFFAVGPYTINLVELLGLGFAIDYSLLTVRRYREQSARGQTRTEATVETMATAGRAVLFSGVAAAIGLALLLFMPVPFVRAMGLAGLLIPLVAIAATFTLQPVLLLTCGGRTTRRSRVSEWWRWWAAVVLGRPVRALVAGVAVLTVAAVPALFLRVEPASFAGLPQSLEATRALGELRHAFGPGAVTPTQVVVDTGRTDGATMPAVRAAVDRLSNKLFHDPEVYVVALGRQAPYVSTDGRFTRVLVVGRHDFGSPASRQLVDRLRASYVPAARFPRGTTALTGGAAPQGADFLARTYGFFPWLVLGALALTYVVLARAFRSLVLPLKAVVLNVLSVAASYGLLVLVFHGAQIEAWVPVFLFAVLFGLSMDYEVFLVSRIREVRDCGSPTTDAIAHGLEQTGGVITAAAVVMVVSFAGFVVGSVPGLRQFGVGLIIAVLIDATIVRAALSPSIMALLGRWNWWLPGARARKRLAVVTAAVLVAVAAPTTAAASPTIRLAIAHVVQHCHVWRTPARLLGASTKLTIKPGTRLVIRADCPMDFDYVQTRGPRLALGNPRTFAGQSRVIVFRKPGIYRLQVKNVQTPEDRGLVTLGETNVLTLTVIAR
ncbi:MAG TPA: MMPL family transporter [Gaiellaceae bacterium]|nr:MMPL family transporter [Gaiellaceae bacterium]